MVNLLDQAVEAARRLPLQNQNEIAQIMLRLTEDDASGVYQLSPEERAVLAESKAQAACGEFASEADIEAIWEK